MLTLTVEKFLKVKHVQHVQLFVCTFGVALKKNNVNQTLTVEKFLKRKVLKKAFYFI